MSSPIDCSSTGASSGAPSPTSDGLDGPQSVARTTFHEAHLHDKQEHDGLDREEHDDEEHDDEEHDDEEHDDEEHDDEEHDDEEHDDDEHDNDEHGDDEHGDEEDGDETSDNKSTNEENIDGETTDGHTEAEIADDGGLGYEEVEVGLLPRDNNPLRDRPVCLLTLISCLFALAAIMYSAHEPLPAYPSEPPQMPAWLANLEPARPEVLIPLDVAGSVRAIVELYEPFMGGGAGLLAARSWPSGDVPSLSRHTIPGADFEELGGTIAFFDELGRNITEFCATVEIHSIPAGDTWRPNEELEELCRPLVTLSRSASTAYAEVAYGLAGPQHGTRWLRRVMVEVLDLAHAVAGPDGTGHNLEGAADYLTGNASTSSRLRRHVGPRDSWQAANSKFKATLWRLHLSSAEVERMWLRLVPVARSFIAGTLATAVGDGGPGSLHAQVAGDWLQLESAVAVVRELAIAAEDGIKALIMAQHRLQELYDSLGCVKQACLVKRHGDDGDEVRGRLVLADPSVLREELFGTADWLEARMTDSGGEN